MVFDLIGFFEKYNFEILILNRFFLTFYVFSVFYSCNTGDEISDYNTNERFQVNENVDAVILPETLNRLKDQAEHQFDIFRNFDLEAADEYAPKLNEFQLWRDKIDLKKFKEQWGFLDKTCKSDGKIFGEDDVYDTELIKKITSRASILRINNVISNFERVKIHDPDLKINDIICSYGLNEGTYNVLVRLKTKDDIYIDIENCGCILLNRGCINGYGWKYKGRYNIHTKNYVDSKLNQKGLDVYEENKLREKKSLNK